MRKRMGKREREAAKRDAFQKVRAKVIADNLSQPRASRDMMLGVSTFDEQANAYVKVMRPAKAVPKAPKGLSSTSTAGRDRLKGASSNVGFVGPRGYHTPKDHVSKAEQTPGMLAPRRPAITGTTSKRFNRDGYAD